jgi:hypothetical protein
VRIRSLRDASVERDHVSREERVSFMARLKPLDRRLEAERRALPAPLRQAFTAVEPGRREYRERCGVPLEAYRASAERSPTNDALAEQIAARCEKLRSGQVETCDALVERRLGAGEVESAVAISEGPGCSLATIAKVSDRVITDALAGPKDVPPCQRVSTLRGAQLRVAKAGKPEYEDRIQGELAGVQPACDAFLRQHARLVKDKPWALAMLQALSARYSPGKPLGVPPSSVKLQYPIKHIPDIIWPLTNAPCVTRPVVFPTGGHKYQVTFTCTEEEQRNTPKTLEVAKDDIRTKVLYIERADGTTEKVVSTSPTTRLERSTVNSSRWRYRLDVSVDFASERNPKDHFSMVLYLPWSKSAGGRQWATLPLADGKEVFEAIGKHASTIAEIEKNARVTVLRGRLRGRDEVDREDAAVELITREDDHAIRAEAIAVLAKAYQLPGERFTY